MNKLNRWLVDLNVVSFVVIAWVVMVAWLIIFNVTIDLLNIDITTIVEAPEIDDVVGYIIAIVFVPIVETLFSQTLPYWGLRKILFVRRNICIVFLISAMIFAVQHLYSVEYMIYTFVLGVVLIYFYHLRRYNSPYWTITGLHAVFNTSIAIGEVASDAL